MKNVDPRRWTSDDARATTWITLGVPLVLVAATSFLIGCSSSTPPSGAATTSLPKASPSHLKAPSRVSAPSATGYRPYQRSDYPSASNTGVPAGTALTPYAGPCIIKDGSTVRITAKDVAATCDALLAYDGSFVISNSKLPRVEADWPGKVSATDSDIFAGDQSTFSAAISYNLQSPKTGYNLVIKGTDISGGKDSVECRGNCDVQDSYLHGQRSYGGAHIQGFLSSGGNHILLRHNSIACDPPTGQGDGCTADVALFGDLAQVNDVIIDHNLMLGGPDPSFCLYGGYQLGKKYPVSTNVVMTNNVFQAGPYGKCGHYGPTTSISTSAPGTVYTGNVWTDGTPVAAVQQ